MEEIYDKIFISSSNLNKIKTKSYHIKKLKNSTILNESNRSTILSTKEKRYSNDAKWLFYVHNYSKIVISISTVKLHSNFDNWYLKEKSVIFIVTKAMRYIDDYQIKLLGKLWWQHWQIHHSWWLHHDLYLRSRSFGLLQLQRNSHQRLRQLFQILQVQRLQF